MRTEDFEINDCISREQRCTFVHDFSVKWAQILERNISGKGGGRGRKKEKEEEEEKELNQSESG